MECKRAETQRRYQFQGTWIILYLLKMSESGIWHLNRALLDYVQDYKTENFDCYQRLGLGRTDCAYNESYYISPVDGRRKILFPQFQFSSFLSWNFR